MRGRCCYERCGGVDREGTLIKKEEYHEAARVLEQAFEETGRSRKDVSLFPWSLVVPASEV